MKSAWSLSTNSYSVATTLRISRTPLRKLRPLVNLILTRFVIANTNLLPDRRRTGLATSQPYILFRRRKSVTKRFSGYRQGFVIIFLEELQELFGTVVSPKQKRRIEFADYVFGTKRSRPVEPFEYLQLVSFHVDL